MATMDERLNRLISNEDGMKQVLELGSHDLFLAEVTQVCVQDRYFRADGSIDEAAMKLVCYVHGKYVPLAEPQGFFGYAVASPEAKKRRGLKEDRG